MKPSFPRLELKAWLLILVGLLVTIQAFFFFYPEYATQEFYDTIGVTRGSILRGRVWTLLTYSFFHHPFQLSHLIVNALSLFYLSSRISHILGSSKSLQILCWGILSSAVFHVILDPFLRPDAIPLIGISGGVLSLFAVLCTIAPDTVFWPLFVSGRNLFYAILITTIFFIVTAPTLHIPILSQIGVVIEKSALSPIFQVGHACHLGGLLMGWLIAKRMIRVPRMSKIHLNKK